MLARLAARQLLAPGRRSLAGARLCGAVVHAVAQVSDPLESLFKRAVGVKDSSNFLPGHGGFLDRFDSFLLAGPVLLLLHQVFLEMKKISVLGSTGSIGTNTLEVVAGRPPSMSVVGLAAGSNTHAPREQVRRFSPKIVSLKTKAEADRLRSELGGLPVRVVHGPEGAEEVARLRG